MIANAYRRPTARPMRTAPARLPPRACLSRLVVKPADIAARATVRSLARRCLTTYSRSYQAVRFLQQALPHRPDPAVLHLLGLINPVLVITGNIAGDMAVAMGVVYMLGVGPMLDWLLGEARPARPAPESGTAFEALLRAHAVLQLIAVATLLHRAQLDANAWTTWVAALSTGLCSGASGIIVAHELGHKRPSWSTGVLRFLCLWSVLYAHFTTEHNHTHHKHVATPADPATARHGESLWAFVLRTVPGQFTDAWAVHERKGRTGLRNPMWHGLAGAAAMLAAIHWTIGAWPLMAFIAQAAFAVFLLEYINYIRHYGLQRQAGERLRPCHAWQSESRWSRWTLLELTRHPAHHLSASVPFWRLQPEADAPCLPGGYYSCFWLAVVPSVWRARVHPRLPTQSPVAGKRG